MAEERNTPMSSDMEAVVVAANDLEGGQLKDSIQASFKNISGSLRVALDGHNYSIAEKRTHGTTPLTVKTQGSH